MTLPDRFRRLLAAHHLTIAELAEAAGMSRQAAWAIVTGKVENPTILTVERLVEAAGGTMQEFYADEDSAE